MAKKLYSRPGPSAKQRSARLKFVKKNKSLTVERGQNDHLFLDQCPKYIVSAALSKKLYCLGVEVAPAQQVIKKLKMNHLGPYMLHGLSHLIPQRLQMMVIKNKRGMPVTELLNTSTRQGKKHILEISCKNDQKLLRMKLLGHPVFFRHNRDMGRRDRLLLHDLFIFTSKTVLSHAFNVQQQLVTLIST